MKYIDADKLIAILERQNVDKKVIQPLIRIIDSLQQEQQEELDKIFGEEEGQVAGRDFVPVDWVETLEMYGKWKIVQAEKDLGWHPSTEHPPVDEEVIVLLGRYEDFPQIAFGHIVDQSIAIDYNGWNIPGVKYWMPCPKIPKEKEV